MLKVDPAVTTVGLAAILAIAIGFEANHISLRGPGTAVAGTAHADTSSASAPVQQWAASATGRVEPKDGEIRIGSQLGAKIVEVLAKTNDKVSSGDAKRTSSEARSGWLCRVMVAGGYTEMHHESWIGMSWGDKPMVPQWRAMVISV